MTNKFDVCISGGGMVGSTLALLLAQQRLRVGWVAGESPAQDMRAYSLNARSRALLESVRCWPSPEHATPIQHMQVRGDEGGEIQFDAPSREGLAWVVNVTVLQKQLFQAIEFQSNIQKIETPEPSPLTVICEGKNSITRQQLGVEYETLPYAQTAISARLLSNQPHQQIAHQWFIQNEDQELEILALLPMDGMDGKELSLIWSVPTQKADSLLTISNEEFLFKIQQISQQVGAIFHLNSERVTWPLHLSQAKQWCGIMSTGGAWALAGDAAHTIHPLAGLGLNLGLADVQTLADILKTRDAQNYWRPIGDRHLLRQYERTCKAHLMPTWIACDVLQRLFAHPHSWIQTARNWGFNGVNQAPLLKQWLTTKAMQ
ncbi:MAG: ubiquinone biosynthesis protein UbiH [Limnohabitans sp.]|nr:ubiquinone biosynthesis protein UbiH [Limnohabitans sp.]